MCDSCGCTPCTECGAPVEDGVCSSCGEKPGNCTCEPLDEELDYEEKEETEDEDEDYEDDEDDEEEEEEEEEEDEDSDDGKDW